MDRALIRHSSCLLVFLALGCSSDSRQLASNKPALRVPHKQTSSPEAAVLLRQLGFAAEVAGGVEADHDASTRLSYLEGELRHVSARLGPDGKVYDRDRREVRVWQQSGGSGAWISEEMIRRQIADEEEQLRKLRERFTVIVLPYFGPLPC
jgi:hypothetical protein